MEVFEIHITGSKGINDEFDRLGLKNIVVDLLTPNKEIIRSEYMSSFISKHKNYFHCKKYVDGILNKLESKILRVKVECPYYEHYLKKALYLESHFKPLEQAKTLYPVSRNAKSGKLMATDRTYRKSEFNNFRDKWEGEDIEMCLYDTACTEDEDWTHYEL